MRKVTSLLIGISAFLATTGTANAKKATAIFNSITFEDGTTVTEAVDFTNQLGDTLGKIIKETPRKKTPANKAREDKEQMRREEEGIKRIGRVQECMAEIKNLRQPENQNRLFELDVMSDRTELDNRVEIIGNVMIYLAGDEDGAMTYLFKKYGFPKRYSTRYVQIEKWNHFRRRNIRGYRNDLIDGTDDVRKIYLKLIDDLIKEALYERGGMTKYEQMLYKAERCKSVANGKGEDLVKVRVQEMAQTVDRLWNGDYAGWVRDLKRGIKNTEVN